jgi:TPR repeat protein
MRCLIAIAALGLLACGSSVTPHESARPAQRHARAAREICPSSTSAATCTAMGESESDPEAAAALFTRACRAGDALGCARLAERYEQGRGVEHSMRRALSLYDRACRDELWKACTILGWLLDAGRGVEHDRDRAIALYEQACSGGERVACSNLGVFYRDGSGVGRSLRRAAALFSKSCELGHGSGCAHLAEVLETGGGDPTSALFFRLKGCLAGHRGSCADLDTPARTRGSRKEAADAACRRGNGRACLVLGHLLLDAGHSKRAERRALAIYRKACDMSQAFGCLALARMFEQGRGVAADRQRADSLRGRACAMDALTCRRPGGR